MKTDNTSLGETGHARRVVSHSTDSTSVDGSCHMGDLISAFLHRIRQIPDDQQCLSPEHVKILFSNIEDILELHKEVLSAVESSLQPEPHPNHSLGHVFLQF
ncbi:Phosphatidylinositol-3,4,5-trisphosphate-dependent Rac exchanger 1 protein, partial [Ameca splendens]